MWRLLGVLAGMSMTVGFGLALDATFWETFLLGFGLIELGVMVGTILDRMSHAED